MRGKARRRFSRREGVIESEKIGSEIMEKRGVRRCDGMVEVEEGKGLNVEDGDGNSLARRRGDRKWKERERNNGNERIEEMGWVEKS